MPSNNILISVVYTEDWQPIIDITRPTIEEYCSKHPYHYTYNKYERGLKDFDKIRILLEVLKEGHYDFIWCLDADAIITNQEVKVDNLLNDINELFVTKDINGINCGSFIVKSGIWAEWLSAWMLDVEGIEGKHCEQDALNYYIECFHAQAEKKIKILPQSTINSYLYELYPEFGKQTKENGQWIEGESFVLHLPGIPLDKRVEILKNIKITK